MVKPLVIGITGASGAVYAARLLQVLATHRDRPIHITVSPAAVAVFHQELGVHLDLQKPDWTSLWPEQLVKLPRNQRPPLIDDIAANLPLWQLPLIGGFEGDGNSASPPPHFVYHKCGDYMAPIASGSFMTSGMVIVPCSGSTLGNLVHATGSNLIHRSADVHLKERRKLVLVPRETPLSQIQLENMARAAQVGAIVLPAMPGWYHGVRSLVDLVDFVVARILDQFEVPHQLMRRWGSPAGVEPE